MVSKLASSEGGVFLYKISAISEVQTWIRSSSSGVMAGFLLTGDWAILNFTTFVAIREIYKTGMLPIGVLE